jgi:colicin import membrane protein
MSAAILHERRPEPGAFLSPVLAALVHAVLLAVLMFGVRWQSRPPDAVTVELWEPPAVEPRPVPKAEPAPAPKPKVEPPPVPKPEPRIEKPDIAEKAPPPKPRPEPKSKPEPPKAAPKPPSDAEAQRRLREELAREQQLLALEREREAIRERLARDAAAASQRALAGWIDRIRAKIRANILLPPDLKGNPEAIFDVAQLPTGEVLTVKLRKSSGHAGYDAAVERAILKSSPLPKPDRAELFQRNLELRFRPLDPI